MLEEDGIKPIEILQRAREQFEQDVSDPSPFVTYRGIEKTEIRTSKGHRDFVRGYIDTLPEFHGLPITDLIGLEISNRKRAEQETGEPFKPVSIVDLGYGNGKFLLDARKRWGADVQLTGYGNDKYTKKPKLYSYEKGGVYYPPTRGALGEARVRLVNGNAIDIRKKLGDNSVDFLVSSLALAYVNYPAWEMIKKIYRVLAPGGVALLDMDNHFEIREAEAFLQDSGYDFEWSEKGIAFRKTNPDINVPLRTSWTKYSVPRLIIGGNSVGERGLEPPTSRSQTARSTN